MKPGKSRTVTSSHKGNTRHNRHTFSISVSDRLSTQRHVDIAGSELEPAESYELVAIRG